MRELRDLADISHKGWCNFTSPIKGKSFQKIHCHMIEKNSR